MRNEESDEMGLDHKGYGQIIYLQQIYLTLKFEEHNNDHSMGL